MIHFKLETSKAWSFDPRFWIGILFITCGVANAATDPGVRPGPPGAGDPLPGLTPSELAFFNAGKDAFIEVNSVLGTEPGAPEAGLGPRFNMNSCVACHAQPAAGGTSPFVNPQVAMATQFGAQNTVPFFIKENGPVREARFKFHPDGTRDGLVHQLFVITGREDAIGCKIVQPNFAKENAKNNLSLRIPSPVFGGGLIEQIPDATILENKGADLPTKRKLGIYGRENRNSADNTITRFGWKAQIKSLLAFSAEAYQVEQGVSNEGFPQENDPAPECIFNGTPEDRPDFDAGTIEASMSDVQAFTEFMRFLGPPVPAAPTASTIRGAHLFSSIGCALCHTPSLTTGESSFEGLSFKSVNLYSDLLLHRMGPTLADNIIQGDAGPDEFRTAPLWGLGQRIFFLHDGRTTDLSEAIAAHAIKEGRGFSDLRLNPYLSEAYQVIRKFDALADSEKQDILNFLRSL